MKKFVTTLVSLFAVLTLAVGFTACEKEKEVCKQVTEEQWKAAVNYFSSDKEVVDVNERNCIITYKYTDNGAEIRTENLELNASAKVIHAKSSGDYSHGENTDVWTSEEYYWEENGKVVAYSKEQSNEEEADDYKGVIDSFASINEMLLLYPSYTYLCEVLNDFKVIEKYGAFTYDGETDAYCGELKIPDEEEVYTTRIYFENYKIVKVDMTTAYNDASEIKHDLVYNFTVSYGNAKVVVPQTIKDMPLEESD